MRAELLGKDAAVRALDELTRRMSDLSPVWRDILADWKAAQKSVFSSEGASIGAHWPPLSPRYAAWKAKHYGGAPMLVRSGHLRTAAEGSGSGFSEKIAPLALEFKITEPTASFHNPTRPVARMSNNDERRWFRIFQTYADRVTAAVR